MTALITPFENGNLDINSFKKIVFITILFLLTGNVFADNHSTNTELVEKAKEITNEISNFKFYCCHINYNNRYESKDERNFLINLGALERLEILKKSTNSEKIKNDLDAGLLRIIENSQMGELFKVCAISPKNKLIPEGFD